MWGSRASVLVIVENVLNVIDSNLASAVVIFLSIYRVKLNVVRFISDAYFVRKGNY